MRVVFDTNVLVSATVFGGTPRTAFRVALEGTVQLVTSRDLLEEYERVLEAKFGFTAAASAAARAEIEAIADIVDAEPIAPTSRDPDDDRFLATALAGRCDAIVSGDDDLLVLEVFRDIPILTARAFVERLDER